MSERIRKTALVALAVAGWFLVQALVESVATAIALAGSPGLYQDVNSVFIGFAYRLGTLAVPFALGLFLAWAFAVQVTGELGLRAVVLRSTLAGLLASVLVAIIRVVVDAVATSSFDRSFFAQSFPQLTYGGADPVTLLLSSVQGIVGMFISSLPLAVLAGILLWHWLRRAASTRGDVV